MFVSSGVPQPQTWALSLLHWDPWKSVMFWPPCEGRNLLLKAIRNGDFDSGRRNMEHCGTLIPISEGTKLRLLIILEKRQKQWFQWGHIWTSNQKGMQMRIEVRVSKKRNALQNVPKPFCEEHAWFSLKICLSIYLIYLSIQICVIYTYVHTSIYTYHIHPYTCSVFVNCDICDASVLDIDTSD